MDKRLLSQALCKFAAGLLVFSLLVFLPVGTLDFWRGKLLTAILFIPMFVAGIVLLFLNPELLRKRLNARESEPQQRRVVAFSALMFIAVFVVAGLNERFGWMRLPDWVSWAAAVLFLLGYLMYGEVLHENAYLSRTVEVQANQKVIDSGLYGVVRHPMYAATLLMFLSMPLVLGSPLSLLPALCYIPIIGKRIQNEEKVLAEGLDGYAAYQKRVKYKVIPHIW